MQKTNTKNWEINPVTEKDKDIYTCIFKMYEEILEKTGDKLRNGIAQDLFGIRVSLQHFILKHGHEDKILPIKKMLRDVIYDLSGVANDLNPTVLLNTGFLAAVEELIFRFRKGGIAMKYKIDPKIGAESPGFQLSCFRVIQDILHKNFRQKPSNPMYLQLSMKNKMLSLFLDGFLDPQLNKMEAYVAYSDLLFLISNRIAMYSGSVDIHQRKGNNQLIIKMYI